MTQEPNTVQADAPPPRRNWPDAVGRDTRGLSQSAFARVGFRDPTLVLRWSAVAGADVARLAQPIRLSAGPSGGVLTLKAEPGAALFLQHESRALCERINSFLGYPAVTRLKFVQGHLAQRPAPKLRRQAHGSLVADDPALSCRAPEPLRDALLRLALGRATCCEKNETD